jgi:hypothetical protein
MRKLVSIAIVGIAALAILASTAAASCVSMTVAQQKARADIIFDGVALQGPTPSGIQRFRVTRYLKARGPSVVRVNTGNIRRADGTGSITSVSISAKRGERWRIYARGPSRRVLRTSLCDGSRKLP